MLLPGMSCDTVVMFAPGYTHAADVPWCAVSQRPSASKSITRPVLCGNHRPGEAGSCPMGRRCHYYHVECDWRSLRKSAAHVRWVYSSAAECEDARCSAEEVTVYGEDADVGERVRVSDFMQTRAVLTALTVVVPAGTVCDDVRDVAYACHMYESHGLCPLGRDCPNAHRIAVDPNMPCGERRWATAVSASVRCGGAAADVRGAGAHPFYVEGDAAGVPDRLTLDARVTSNAAGSPASDPAESSADAGLQA